MNTKKIVCILLSFLFILLVACSNNGTSSDNANSSSTQIESSPSKKISLLYSASDSLNPYKAETELNRQIGLLIFDSLVKLDSEFQPQYILAKSIEISKKECTITLKNALFSDGSAVTADDVAFSLKLAQESKLKYSEQLKTVKSYTVEATDTIKLHLTKTDPYFGNMLDFPIMKKDSDNLKDENNIILCPTGSGRYVFDNETKRLKANNMYILGVPTTSEIELINAPDETVVKYNLEANNVSIYYSPLNDGVIPSMSGKSIPLALNNLIYLGVNLNNSFLKDAKARYAVSAAISRTEICNDAYYSYATEAVGIFNAAFSDAGSLQNLSKTPDLENVVANLTEIGYNEKNDDGFYISKNNKVLTLKLVTYDGNERSVKTAELIKQQLESVGIKVNLVSLNWDDYVTALKERSFDLYLAEVQLGNNMDVTELVTSNGKLAYGILSPTPASPSTEEDAQLDSSTLENDEQNSNNKPDDKTEYISSVPLLDNVVSAFYNEELSLVDIINAFNAELPIIPVCHRLGITVCDAKLNVDSMSSISDAYFGIMNIK